MKERKRIFITGSCSAAYGNWEQQLGNAAILIGLLETIHKYLPDVDISTKYHLSSDFCYTYGIKVLPVEPESGKKLQRIYMTFFNLIMSLIWRILYRLFKTDIKILHSTSLLNTYYNNDIIIDLSGDTYGDNIPLRNFIKHSFDLLSAKLMGKPVVSLANSPGPFSGKLRRFIASLVFNNLTLITTREPISASLLRNMNIRTPIITTACPAFLLESAQEERVKQLMELEGITENYKPLIGFTLGGYNLYSEQTWDTPKTLKDIELYIPVINFLLNNLHAQVLLIPHVYRIDPRTGQYIQGPDYFILKAIYQEITKVNNKVEMLKLIEGTYSPYEVKGLIGELDFFISGRLHAGVAALSQCVPTVLLAYGHKHFGFAKMLNIEQYIWHPSMGKDRLTEIVKEAWENKEKIRVQLSGRIPLIKERAELNAKILRDILRLNEDSRLHLSEDFLKEYILEKEENNLPDLNYYLQDIYRNK